MYPQLPMAGRKLRLQIQQSQDHGECRDPRWYGQHAITTDDITGSVMKILITDSKGTRISITIGKNGGIRGVNTENEAQINTEESNILSHLLGNNRRSITGTEVSLEPNLKRVKEEVKELEESARESLTPFKEILDVRSEGYDSESLLPEVQEEFHTVMENIKSERSDQAGNFETVYINGEMMAENYAIPKIEEVQTSEDSSSSQVFESTNCGPTYSMLCRLCAAPRRDMVYIFGENGAYKNIVEKIENCLSILVRKRDPLPNRVCRLCLEKLELCHKFRTTVAEAEKQFIMLGERELDEFRNGEKDLVTYSPPPRRADKSRSSVLPKKLGKKGSTDEDIIFVGEAIHVDTTADEVEEYDIIKCRICGLFFGTAKSCHAHSEIHSLPDYFPCSMCESVFTGRADSLRHSLEHIRRKSRQRTASVFEKQVPSERTSNGTDNTAEKNTVKEAAGDESFSQQIDGQDMIKCRICGLYFGTGKSCYLHAEIHYSENYYPCSMCNRTFTGRIHCHKHSFEHTVRKSGQRQDRTGNNSSLNAAEDVEGKNGLEGIVNDQVLTEQSGQQDMVKCRICGLYFGTSRSCIAHSEIHYSFESYPCSMCEKVFTTRADSYKHSVEHTTRKCLQRKALVSEKENSADEDSTEETTTAQTSPEEIEHKYDIIKCRICGLYFGTPKSCYLHSAVHYSENYYPCVMCDKIFKTKVDIRRHSVEHTVRNPEVRKIWMHKKHMSGYNLRSTKAAKGSKTSNGGETVAEKNEVEEVTSNESENTNIQDMVKCRICGSFFGTAKSCYAHSKTHATENYLPCSLCDQVFTNEKDSCKHNEEHIVQKKYQNQMYVHTEHGKYSCKICGREFRSDPQLKGHQAKHTDLPYKCSTCKRRFLTNKNLNRHKMRRCRSALKDKNFSCFHCGMTFLRNYSLTNHMKKKHTRERAADGSFGCKICKRRFSDSNGLKQHLHTHSEHRPFACLMCDKAFKSSKTRKEHMRAVHLDDKRYKCDLCGKRFMRPSTMQIHKRARHEMK